ncbi:MAG: nicotinate phosphoribosyltransferase [Gemmatimonadota bacterium]
MSDASLQQALPAPLPWVAARDLCLLTDLYQLAMVRAYWEEDMRGEAVFSLFARRLPPSRNFLLACGQEAVLEAIEGLAFDDAALRHLATFEVFPPSFLDWLAGFRFTGDVFGVPEGTPVFAREPIVEVVAPLPQAQLVETLLVNQVHLQTVLASKATRVVSAARGHPVVDFGLRRSHGVDAGLKAARAFYVAGVAATSNVLAGKVWGIPVSGTMTHSYLEAHADELEALRAFAARFADTTLLVDSHGTLEGVRNVITLATELGDSFDVRAVRLDPGRDGRLAKEARAVLDQAGLSHVDIFASGGLDEASIDRLMEAGTPIAGFGVGTEMSVPRDAPSLDLAYALSAYRGPGPLKIDADNILPGRKQIFRVEVDGVAMRDVIARADEERPGTPLLVPLMSRGRRTQAARRTLPEIRDAARASVAALPERVRGVGAPDTPYPVEVSDRLEEERRRHAEAPAAEDH